MCYELSPIAVGTGGCKINIHRVRARDSAASGGSRRKRERERAQNVHNTEPSSAGDNSRTNYMLTFTLLLSKKAEG